MHEPAGLDITMHLRFSVPGQLEATLSLCTALPGQLSAPSLFHQEIP